MKFFVAEKILITVFCIMTSCLLVGGCHFWGKYCLHLQGRTDPETGGSRLLPNISTHLQELHSDKIQIVTSTQLSKPDKIHASYQNRCINTSTASTACLTKIHRWKNSEFVHYSCYSVQRQIPQLPSTRSV